MTYKHASRNGPIAGGVVSILLEIGALVDERLAGGRQSLLLEVTLEKEGTVNETMVPSLDSAKSYTLASQNPWYKQRTPTTGPTERARRKSEQSGREARLRGKISKRVLNHISRNA